MPVKDISKKCERRGSFTDICTSASATITPRSRVHPSIIPHQAFGFDILTSGFLFLRLHFFGNTIACLHITLDGSSTCDTHTQFSKESQHLLTILHIQSPLLLHDDERTRQWFSALSSERGVWVVFMVVLQYRAGACRMRICYSPCCSDLRCFFVVFCESFFNDEIPKGRMAWRLISERHGMGWIWFTVDLSIALQDAS